MNSVQADFDRIALLDSAGFDHNAHYHRLILEALPKHAANALEIGCGSGEFSRLLAARCDRVTALDLSANMIAAAMQKSASLPHLEFRRQDVLHWDWPAAQFDAIVSVATLHHLPMADMFTRMKASLSPGGTLAILDLRRTPAAANLIALPWSLLLNLVHTGRPRAPKHVRDAWAEHGKTDRYLTIEEVRTLAEQHLPGAEVRKLLLWRYLLIWRKPA